MRPQRGRLLGVGCIEAGYGLSAAKERGWEIDAVEWSPILAEHARKHLSIPARVSAGWDLSVCEGNQYDVVYSLSIEHMLRPREILQHEVIARPS